MRRSIFPFAFIVTSGLLMGATPPDELEPLTQWVSHEQLSDEELSFSSNELTGRRFGFVCTGVESARVCRDPGSGYAVSFLLENVGKNKINPKGAGVRRDYQFFFPGRARQNTHLQVFDRARSTGRDSDISMLTDLHLFPRRVLPSLALVETGTGAKVLEVRLPTGEAVCFDPSTMEIVGGLLEEDPIDSNPTASERQFPRVTYRGAGILIRSNQRGASTKLGGEKAKPAVITFGERRCQVPRSALWEQDSGWFDFRFSTDGDFFAFLEEACGWAVKPFEAPLPTASYRCTDIGRAIAETPAKPKSLPMVGRTAADFLARLQDASHQRRALVARVLEYVGMYPNPLWKRADGAPVVVPKGDFARLRVQRLRQDLERRAAREAAFVSRSGGPDRAQSSIRNLAARAVEEALTHRGLEPGSEAYRKAFEARVADVATALAREVVPMFSEAKDRAVRVAGTESGPGYESIVDAQYRRVQAEYRDMAGELTRADRMELDMYWQGLPLRDIARIAGSVWEALLTDPERRALASDFENNACDLATP